MINIALGGFDRRIHPLFYADFELACTVAFAIAPMPFLLVFLPVFRRLFPVPTYRFLPLSFRCEHAIRCA